MSSERMISTIATQQLNWDRSQFCSPKPQLISTPASFSPDGDGIDEEYCITVCGADYYDVEITNQSSSTIVYQNTGVFINSPIVCIWDGGNEPADNYDIKITLYSCGQANIQNPYTISLVR